MRSYTPDQIRNVAVVAHGSAGKTSLCESMLFASKTTSRLGRIEDGNTLCDYDQDEIKRRMSISAAVAPLEWRDTKINLIDTPGYADFVGEVKSALRVTETALIVVDASAGVEVGTEQVWKYTREEGLATIVFVNKLARENADFERTIESLRSAFGNGIAPIHVPIGKEKSFRGVVDLVAMKAHIYDSNLSGSVTTEEIPVEMAEVAERYRQLLIEAACEQDEGLMTRYLEDDEIGGEELRTVLQAGAREGTLTLVCCGSGNHMVGVDLLLDALVDFGRNADTRAEATTLTALVFKTVADPHVGRVSYFRVYSGSIHSNSHIHNSIQDKGERIGQLFFMRGKDHIATEEVGPGDIGAVAKLAVTVTGDTLCADGHSDTLAPIHFPNAAYSASVHPQTKADLDKMGQALHRLVEEDPTLQLGRDPITGEAILSGMGEPHVQIALERMTRRFGVHVEAGLPRVAYRETVTAKTNAEYRHKKQTGGAGQFGHVFLEIEPHEGAEFEFVERVVGGAVPRNFFPAVEKGVREGLDAGPVAGYPVVNVKVTLYDGKYHDVDSNEMAFKIAAKEAFKLGVLQAKPTILEPVLMIHVTVPDNHTGDVMSDLNGKRAHVNGMNPGSDGFTVIDASVPAAEVQRYATDLRSITQGRGHFITEFSHYQPVPPHVAEQIKAAHQHEGAAA